MRHLDTIRRALDRTIGTLRLLEPHLPPLQATTVRIRIANLEVAILSLTEVEKQSKSLQQLQEEVPF